MHIKSSSCTPYIYTNLIYQIGSKKKKTEKKINETKTDFLKGSLLVNLWQDWKDKFKKIKHKLPVSGVKNKISAQILHTLKTQQENTLNNFIPING